MGRRMDLITSFFFPLPHHFFFLSFSSSFFSFPPFFFPGQHPAPVYSGKIGSKSQAKVKDFVRTVDQDQQDRI